MDDSERVRIGCVGLPPRMSRERYFERLRFIEAVATFFDPPKPAVLRRWRRSSPEQTRFAVQAWQVITHPVSGDAYPRLPAARAATLGGSVTEGGLFGDTTVVQHGATVMREAIDAVAAEVVVFRTPASFTPTDQHKAAMARFFSSWRTPALTVWAPEGMWSPLEALELARDMNVELAFDPIAETALATELSPLQVVGERKVAYLRLAGMGAQQSLDLEHLLDVVEQLEHCDRVWVVFDGANGFGHATRFRALLAATLAG